MRKEGEGEGGPRCVRGSARVRASVCADTHAQDRRGRRGERESEREGEGEGKVGKTILIMIFDLIWVKNN
jgi:hypothetical protein